MQNLSPGNNTEKSKRKTPTTSRKRKPSPQQPKVPEVDWGAMSPDEFADKLTAQMEAKGPMLSCEDMNKIETMWNEKRTTRRGALVLMTKPYSWFRQQVEDDRDFALAVAEVHLHTRRLDFYQGMVDLLEQAHIWTMIALCGREDMAELLAEAEAEE